MRVGIVFVFNDITQEIVTYNIKNLLKNYKTKICFVNNGLDNRLLKFLNEIKENSKAEISIIDIKRNKSEKIAIKAGVRYLSSEGDLSYILYSKLNQNLDIESVKSIMASIKNRSIEAPSLVNKNKRRIFRNVFSLSEIKTLLEVS